MDIKLSQRAFHSNRISFLKNYHKGHRLPIQLNKANAIYRKFINLFNSRLNLFFTNVANLIDLDLQLQRTELIKEKKGKLSSTNKVHNFTITSLPPKTISLLIKSTNFIPTTSTSSTSSLACNVFSKVNTTLTKLFTLGLFFWQYTDTITVTTILITWCHHIKWWDSTATGNSCMYNPGQNTLDFCQHMVFLLTHLPSPSPFQPQHNAELIHPNWPTILTLFCGGGGLGKLKMISHLMSLQNHVAQFVLCQVSIGIMARSVCGMQHFWRPCLWELYYDKFLLKSPWSMLVFKKIIVCRKSCRAELGFSPCLGWLSFENGHVEKILLCMRLLLCRLVCLIGNSLEEKRRLEEEAGHPNGETKTLKRREQAWRTRGIKGRYSMNRYDK